PNVTRPAAVESKPGTGDELVDALKPKRCSSKPNEGLSQETPSPSRMRAAFGTERGAREIAVKRSPTLPSALSPATVVQYAPPPAPTSIAIGIAERCTPRWYATTKMLKSPGARWYAV